MEEARAAENAGADYIGVGAVFGTSTKKDARNLTIEKLQEISGSVSIPVVAIGGINRDNVKELKGSGVDGIAVISAIFAAEDPGQRPGASGTFEKRRYMEMNKKYAIFDMGRYPCGFHAVVAGTGEGVSLKEGVEEISPGSA